MIANQSYIRLITIFDVQHFLKAKPFAQGSFTRSYINPDNRDAYEQEFFEEFRELIFPFDGKSSENGFQFYRRSFDQIRTFETLILNHEPVIYEIQEIEIAIPPAKCAFSYKDYRMGMLSVEVKFQTGELSKIGLALSMMRLSKSKFFELLKEEDYLGFELNDKISKRFSGPKFKIYLVHDVDSAITPDFSDRVFDVGSCYKVGGESNYHSDYRRSIDQYFIRVFNNYESLVLTDSFTIMGKGTLAPEYQTLWKEEIYRIYMYILFLRNSMYLYNTVWRDEADLDRITKEFADFTDYYCFQNISYNFMSELYYDRLKAMLNVDSDLNFFRDRLKRLNSREQMNISEQQTKVESRQNFMISLFGILIAPFSVLSGLFGMNVFETEPKVLGVSIGFIDVILLSLFFAVLFKVILFAYKDHDKGRP